MEKPPDSRLLQAIANLIEKAIPTLHKHPKTWWQLVVIVLGVAVAGSLYSVSTKLEPNKALETIRRPSGMKRAIDDCGVKDGQFIDRDGSCW
jgi:hypothetical protein